MIRVLTAFILLLTSLWAVGQQDRSENWHSGVGLSFSTLNFQQNGAGALAVPLRYDFFTSGPSTFSLGSVLQAGSEDKYGVSFPVLVLLALYVKSSGSDWSWFNDIGNSSSGDNSKGYGIGLFTHVPLLLEYNYGLGTKNGDDYSVGFYMGGGISYTLTGYTIAPGSNMQQSTTFFGWQGNAGIRLGNNLDIGFSLVLPFEDPIGPIHRPIMYQLTLCSFRKRR